ncbi:hypothetical protein CR513_34740, partial [Mucuna pruriens]
MPSSIYRPLNFGDLEPTSLIIQLANKSIAHPLVILEVVLVRIYELIFQLIFILSKEERLLQVLRKHRKAIGWTLVDLPRINPSICMHRILLEEDD